MKPAENFPILAKEFCEWVESSPLSPEAETLKALHLLSGLYFEACQLKYEVSQVEIETPGIPHEEWHLIFKRFSSLPFNYYSVVSDPLNLEDTTAAIGDVADDLADIYRDLKSGVWLFNNGYIIEAYNEWKVSFNCHWGTHTTNALNVLHYYASSNQLQL